MPELSAAAPQLSPRASEQAAGVAEDLAIAGDIRQAVLAAGSGDAPAWQQAVERAARRDLAVADRLARAELLARLARHGVAAGMVVEIVSGTTQLAAAAEGGPFECPAFLLELAVRRALDEPGCTDHVELGELLYAQTQCAGMLDLHDVLLPPGWGLPVYGPLEADSADGQA